MTIVKTQFKVDHYDISTSVITCEVNSAFVWRGDFVRTSGDEPSLCNIDTMIFDVTVDEATAKKLKDGSPFRLEYDDTLIPRLPTNIRRVTKFAGFTILPLSSAAA